MKNLSALALAVFSVISFAKPAPQFQGDLLGGGRTSLKASLKPGRALMVCFWATWCGPCIQELKEVSTRLKNDSKIPLDMVSVNVDTSETSTDVKPTLKLYGFDFPVVLDPKHEIFAKFQSAKSLPFSVLIGANGEIEKTFSGYHEEMFKHVEAIVKRGVAGE